MPSSQVSTLGLGSIVIDLVDSSTESEERFSEHGEDAEEKDDAGEDEEYSDGMLWDFIPFHVEGPGPARRQNAPDAVQRRKDLFKDWGLKLEKARIGPVQERRLEQGFNLRSLQFYEGGTFVDTKELRGTTTELVRICRDECLYKLSTENKIRYVERLHFKLPNMTRCWVRLAYAYNNRVLQRQIELKCVDARCNYMAASESPNISVKMVRLPKCLRHASMTYDALPDKGTTGLYNLMGTTKTRFIGEDSGLAWISKPGRSYIDLKGRANDAMWFVELDPDDCREAEELLLDKLRDLGFALRHGRYRDHFEICQHCIVLYHQVFLEVLKVFDSPNKAPKASGVIAAGAEGQPGRHAKRVSQLGKRPASGNASNRATRGRG